MERKLKIVPPTMPNFFHYEMPARPREEGFKPAPSIPIEELTEEEANEFAEMMKLEFLKHWNRKKQQ